MHQTNRWYWLHNPRNPLLAHLPPWRTLTYLPMHFKLSCYHNLYKYSSEPIWSYCISKIGTADWLVKEISLQFYSRQHHATIGLWNKEFFSRKIHWRLRNTLCGQAQLRMFKTAAITLGIKSGVFYSLRHHTSIIWLKLIYDWCWGANWW